MNSEEDNVEFVDDMLKSVLSSLSAIADIKQLVSRLSDPELISMWDQTAEDAIFAVNGLSAILEEISNDNEE